MGFSHRSPGPVVRGVWPARDRLVRSLLAGLLCFVALSSLTAATADAGTLYSDDPWQYGIGEPNTRDYSSSPAECPASPDSPEVDSDPVVSELRMMRIEATLTCEALSDRLDRGAYYGRLAAWSLTSNGGSALFHEARDQAESFSQIVGSFSVLAQLSLCRFDATGYWEGATDHECAKVEVTNSDGGSGGEPVSDGDPLTVEISNPSSIAEPVAGSVDASGLALKGAVWYVCGLLVACLAGYGIWRTVMPRA